MKLLETFEVLRPAKGYYFGDRNGNGAPKLPILMDIASTNPLSSYQGTAWYIEVSDNQGRNGVWDGTQLVHIAELDKLYMAYIALPEHWSKSVVKESILITRLPIRSAQVESKEIP